MLQHITSINRRKFLQTTAIAAAGTAGASFLPASSFANPYADDNPNIIGPVEGYSPQIGTLVSMLNWIRGSVERAVKNLKPEELDFLMDPKAIPLQLC